jgi:cytochrome c553
MKSIIVVLGLLLSPGLAQAAAPEQWEPKWAFPIPQQGLPPEQSRAVTQADDAIRAVVYPQQAESIPEIVRKGKDGNGVCQGCHLPSGYGQPQSAPIAGLPVAYYLRTMNDFRSGDRKAYRPNMAEFAKAMTEQEIRDTANYYASLRPGPWIEVRESDTVPKTFVSAREITSRVPGGGEEPLGERIVELAPEIARPYQPPGPAYVAYVPRGSLARGQALVNTGAGGRTVACASCHGANLLGQGDVPAIGGRSALHAARELFEYRSGARGGASAVPMKDVVARLTDADIIAIAAYLASRPAI